MFRPLTDRGAIVLGVPVRIDRSWFVIALLMAWTLAGGYFPSECPGLPRAAYALMGGVAAVLLFACVVLHELGHALAARGSGIPVAGVTLFIFGGVAQILREPRRPRTELGIALAGPLVSIVLAAACFAASRVLHASSPAQWAAVAIIRYLAAVNVAILCFNLLPGFPLDGGRVLRAGLWALTGNFRTATRMASLVGAVLSAGLLIWGVWAILRGAWVSGFWYILLGRFLYKAACGSYRQAGR